MRSNPPPISFLTPGTLRARIAERSLRALQRGALQRLPARCEVVGEQGVAFVVRILANLARKEAAARKRDGSAEIGLMDDPFLPYDPELFVADLSPTHLCVLNKFNVFAHHLLIVTRAFEEQRSVLDEEDFAALWSCMSEYPSLGFYNAGVVAGASQRHKHLQVVPLPLGPDVSPAGGRRLGQSPLPAPVPIEPLLAAAQTGGAPRLPFRHALAWLAPEHLDSRAAGPYLSAQYQGLLRAADLDVPASAHPPSFLAPYNLLVTRRWMLLVPRTREHFESISVNGAGFAGALLAKNDDELQRIREVGPLRVLAAVAAPR